MMTEETSAISFKVLEWINVPGRGHIAIVDLPIEKGTVGKKVLLDDVEYEVHAIEYGAKYKGGKAGILIKGDRHEEVSG